MNLSVEQRKAIHSNEPFLFLQACAGSGKTRVIVERVKRLLMEGVKSEDILCITFTRKASHEMLERLKGLLHQVYTFHQFCFQMLKENTEYMYDIFEEGDLGFSPNELLNITVYKNTLCRTKKPKSYSQYQLYLKENKLKDFDDLLIDFLNLRFNKTYKYIFIDEFQDTNLLQYEVLKKLAKNDTHLFAVGDPNQSIYRFRGSNNKIIHQYIMDYKAVVLTLTTNYRSSRNIIEVSNHLIRHNPKKDYLQIVPFHPLGESVEIICFLNRVSESALLIERLKNYIHQNPHHSIAILYRNHERAYDLIKGLYDLDDYFLRVNESVQFLTIHQSKGLEFDLVILIGLEQGELPSLRSNQEIELEEERRLCYVGMTRAKKKLILSYVKTTNSKSYHTPSVFLLETKLKTNAFKSIK